MPSVVELPEFKSDAGNLTVFEKVLGRDIKRAFFIYGVGPDETRAKHGHLTATNALICIKGSCRITITNTEIQDEVFVLDQPNKCLIINPKDWHTMDQFSADAILAVMSDQHYDKDGYFYEKP
jgi:tellurite resistance-related uncharacterized protein